jgi:hypothetical protein
MTPSVKAFLLGVGSVVGGWDYGPTETLPPVESSFSDDELLMMQQYFDSSFAAWNAGRELSHQHLALLASVARQFATHPQLRELYPQLFAFVESSLSVCAQRSAQFGPMQSTGRLWVDQIRLAADRQRMRRAYQHNLEANLQLAQLAIEAQK